MRLRDYQQQAYESAVLALDSNHHPVLQLATGTGKSLIISALAEHFNLKNKRVWVLTHVKKLVSQNAQTFQNFTGDTPGIVCAALNKKEYDSQITFATIQSIKRPAQAGLIEAPELIIIDEAHRVPHVGSAGNYETLFNLYPQAQRVAMTATPWRMDNGIIYGLGEAFWFDKLAYKYTVPEAVKDGWLSPLVGVESEIQLDVENLTVNGDFVQEEAGELETNQWLTQVAHSIGDLAAKRNHIIVFCPSINATDRTTRIIQTVTGWSTASLTSATKNQTQVLTEFETGRTRVLCSVDMITTGFDFPAIDCIVVLRPTLSSNLWVQMQGRGTRLSPNKKNCLVLDYVGNLMRLGGVDLYETFYREKGLVQLEAIPYKPYEKRERKLLPGVKTLIPIDPVTGESVRNNSELVVTVHAINHIAIATRRNPERPVLMVTYACTTVENVRIDATSFIDTEVPNHQTLEFFKQRRLALRLPTPARNASWVMKGARQPTQLTVRKSGRYWNVIKEHFNEEE